ncbi:MAG: flagellar type III secretion system pore protein FliP [Pseudomonadota bacterium]
MRSNALLCVVFSCLFILFSESAAAQGVTSEQPGAEGGELTERIIQIFVLVTVLSLAPGIAMMVTCLPFILIVLSILRQGVGLQQAPPNMLIVSIALFLTYFVMEPVIKEAWANGAAPLIANQISEEAALTEFIEPFEKFMLARVDSEAVAILHDARFPDQSVDLSSPPLSILAPAFVLSEVQRAFQIGFIVLMPFLVIDLLVASILMAMGMMMVPPAIVSLPFKVSFFVLTNGWVAVSAALVRGYAQ